MNTFKTFLLMGALTVLLVLVGNLLGGQSGMMIAFGFAVLMNFGSYWFSDTIVLKMYRAKEVSSGEAPAFHRIVQELAPRAGIPMPRLYVIESDQPNAFATGRNPQRAAVAVTTGLLRMLPEEQVRGVLSHELAHIKHRDILIGTVAATIAGAISMLAQMAQWAFIFGGGRTSSNDDGGNPIALLATLIVAPIAALMIQMGISRSREYLADHGGAEISGDPMALANALRSLEKRAAEIPMKANPATAHMFIVSPLHGGGLTKLFSTHPPMGERIARLERMVYGSTPH